MLDCLKNIVGLSNTDCDCWDSSKPQDFAALNESRSGLYVSDASTIPLRWANSAADCENGGLWQLLLEARTQAVRDLLSDFLAANAEVRQEQFLPFTHIGDAYYKNATLVRGDYLGAYIEPYSIRGAKITVKSVDLTFYSGVTTPVSVDISMYSSLDLSTPIATATANVTSNKEKATATFTSPIVIDLGDVRDDLNERYYFLYEAPVGLTPVYNEPKKGCNCSKATVFKNNPYLQVMKVAGVQTNNVLDATKNTLYSRGMNGLIINASMECDYYSWLCELAQKPNEISNQGGQRLKLGMALADGIRAKAVANLAQSIINSGRINYYTMVLDPANLYRLIGNYLKIYEKAIDNLVYYMPSDVTDCLICAEDKRMRKNQILR